MILFFNVIDIFGNESEDEKMEQEPAAESNLDKPVGKNIVEELANTNTLNKKKKKIVDKMYTDEDGFISMLSINVYYILSKYHRLQVMPRI